LNHRVPPAIGYQLVQLANGAWSVHALAERETFHPVIGPVAEAEALYVRQLGLIERLRAHAGEFVVWDVGLGAAANSLTVLRHTRAISRPLRLVSFDHTLEPLHFGLAHAPQLGYFAGYEPAVQQLLAGKVARFIDGVREVAWEVRRGDFPTLLAQPAAATLPHPDAILFDAYSPARNPSMWTLPLFANLFRRLDPARPCSLATYSRSTLLRVSLLVAGFFVGAGHATGKKEETTLAANDPALIAEPLDRRWLQRARRSTSAEPLVGPVYRQARLSEETWERLLTHPQFR
jgi:tRNA U34 5-methylaminomethyl-2-thiouridine-forming methyltransferase MnmC